MKDKKFVVLTVDTHRIIGDMKRPGESFTQVITRLALFYSHMLFDIESSSWKYAEAGVCPVPIDFSDFNKAVN